MKDSHPWRADLRVGRETIGSAFFRSAEANPPIRPFFLGDTVVVRNARFDHLLAWTISFPSVLAPHIFRRMKSTIDRLLFFSPSAPPTADHFWPIHRRTNTSRPSGPWP